MKDILQPLVKQFIPFAQERMGFDKPPRLFLRNDPKNAQNPLGKTAYYDPEQMSVTLYIDGRHPKDIMRSLSHELVHHTQNCNGQFDHVGEMGEGYAQNDEHLREMERQAYEEGNLCFRDWEDSIKGTIYNESLQKGAKNKMSLKNWKDNELSTLLTEKWGFSFNLLTESQDEEAAEEEVVEEAVEEEMVEEAAEDLDEDAFAPNHYCVHHGGVDRNGSVELAEAVQHNYNNELGRVTHYDMKFADGTIMENVAFEDIQVTNASLEEMHGSHAAKRDEEELDERRGRGRDREGMEPDSRRRGMNEGEDQEELEEGGKPDFLDLDKDGDKEESMKDAAADKKGKMDEAKIRNLIRKLVKEAAKRGR